MNKNEVKVKKSSKGRIDKLESSNLIGFTIIFAIFMSTISGISKIYVPEIIYIFDILPIDSNYLIWILGMSLWGVISILLGLKYKRE